MSDISWKVATTRRDLDDAQRVRWECLAEEVHIPMADPLGVRRDVCGLDTLSTVQHIVVYAGVVPIGTARLALPNPEVARARGSALGLELEHGASLGTLGELGEVLGEVSRLCVRRGHPGAALRLYEGLWVLSQELRLRYWLGGVDCQSESRDEAELMYRILEQRGALSSHFRVERRHPVVNDVAGAPSATRFYSELELERAASGQLGQLGVSKPLEAFTRRLGARCVGEPVRHAVFPRFVLPLLVDLRALPPETLALFEASPPRRNVLSDEGTRGRSSLGAVAARPERAAPGRLHAALLELARDSVARLDRHAIGGALVRGTLSRDSYVQYLLQVVHYVRDSGPMLDAAGRALERQGRHRLALLFRRKAREEDGHDAWALMDLAALGIDSTQALATPACSAVVAYGAWLRHIVESVPVAVLGLAFVLEWYGYTRADRAARNLVSQNRIASISHAVRFLRGHGDADEAHVAALGEAVDEVMDDEEIEATLLTAQLTASLYLGLLEGPRPLAIAS